MNLFVILHPWLSLAALAICALLVGSFLNVVIYRLPRMLQEQLRLYPSWDMQPAKQQPSTRFNLWLPRSHCVHCKHMIPCWYNIPILSYLWLRGRCHSCHHRIDWSYPVVECLTFSLSVAAAYYFGFTLTLLFVLPFLWIVICLTFIDIKHQLLPDSLSLGLLWLGLIANTQTLFTTLPDAVLSAAGAYLGLWLFIQLFYLVTGKIGMGHGDFKLFAALAAWFGWHSLLPILLSASISGVVIGGIYLILTGKTRHTLLAFGPFLCLGGVGYLFFTMLEQF